MRIAARDDLARRPEAVFHDDVVEAAAAAVEEVPDAVPCGEAADLEQRLGSLFGGGREVVIENDDDSRGIGDRLAGQLLIEDAGNEVRAEIVEMPSGWDFASRLGRRRTRAVRQGRGCSESPELTSRSAASAEAP